MVLSCLAGLIVYAKYFECDPLGQGVRMNWTNFNFVLINFCYFEKKISKADQVFPLFVMETVGSFSGLPGLFVAGIFSGALRYSSKWNMSVNLNSSFFFMNSSLSSGLNAAALILMEDFVRPFRPDMSDVTATRIIKLLSVAFGAFCFAIVFLVANVKLILEVQLSI